MESHAKFLGHPIHPMLVVLPLGLFAGAVAFDLVRIWSADTSFAIVSFWSIAGGIAGGLLAALFGAIDWLAIPSRTRAKTIGLWHGLTNVVVVALFALSWWMRWNAPGYVPSNMAFTLSLAAIALGLVAGWLGGELVDRLGVGVDDGAHLDAPNSLQHKRVQPAGPR